MEFNPKLEELEKYRKTADFRDPIFVIESPSPEDLLEGRHEGDSLARILALAGIEVVYMLATNLEMIDAAFEKIALHVLAMPKVDTQPTPFIHFSAHGSPDGIELTDGDTLLWDQLNKRLENLHQLIGPFRLPPPFKQGLPRASVCFSACGVFDSYKAATPTPAPYLALVGSNRDIGWAAALIAFSTFYYQICSLNESSTAACLAMNIAAGAVHDQESLFELYVPE